MDGGIKQVVCCLLKTGRVQNRVLHFGNAKARDA